MLLLALPKSQRSQLGRLLNESAAYESSDKDEMAVIYERLAKMNESVWDSSPEVPVISINLEMPQRAIAEAIESLVRKWKADHNIPEQRRREDKLPDYLATWDAREGWADGAYDGSRERKFEEIAQAAGIPISTVIGQYRSAFRYLSGHDYSPELWIRLMGPLKLQRLVEGGAEGFLRRRPWRSPNLRPVMESVLLPGRKEFEQPEFLIAIGITPSDTALADLGMDIDTLLDRGSSDDEIIEKLEIAIPGAKDLVAELRYRRENR